MYHLVIAWFRVGTIGRLLVTAVTALRLGVDGVVGVDVAVAGQLHPPVALGVVPFAALRLSVVVVVVIILDGPIELVIWRVNLLHRY